MPTTSRGTFSWLFSGVAVLEDFADRLSHVWTFGLLLILASVISWKQQIFNSPIVCVTPVEFSPSFVAYAHQACWSSERLYLVAIHSDIPVYDHVKLGIWLYKWLPVVLCIQALLFKFPSIVMHVLHGYSGISFEKVAGLTQGYQNLNLVERNYLGKQTGRYLYNWCKQCENCFPWRILSFTWLFVKILFCANAITQLALVDKLLSTRNPPFDNSTSYGDVIYANLFNKTATEWKVSPIFPRRVMCDFDVLKLRNVQKYSLQCDLPINEFNEYIYMILWIWLLLVAVISCLSFVVWLVLAIVPFTRERYISKMLDLSYELNSSHLNRNDVSRFTDMVGEDGILILKLIASNSSELVVRDAVTTMFQMEMARQYPPQPPETMAHASTPLLAPAPGQAQASMQAPLKP